MSPCLQGLFLKRLHQTWWRTQATGGEQAWHILPTIIYHWNQPHVGIDIPVSRILWECFVAKLNPWFGVWVRNQKTTETIQTPEWIFCNRTARNHQTWTNLVAFQSMSRKNAHLHPWQLTWNLNLPNLLFLGFHATFPGCTVQHLTNFSLTWLREQFRFFIQDWYQFLG